MRKLSVIVLAMLLLLSGCGRSAEDSVEKDVCSSSAAAEAAFSETKAALILSETTVDLVEGEEYSLTVQNMPEEVAVEWITSDPAVAEVNFMGQVTAHGAGSCTITAYFTEHPDAQASCEINVQQKPHLVVIDAGHQRHGNYEKEPIGPGASEQKAKVSSGTEGVVTGVPEYELNLQIALKLETELKARGYEVIQTRSEHDVDMSNSQRAALANESHADAVLHIHANGSENAKAQGGMTICMTPKNEYSGELYAQSKALARSVVDHMCAVTGAENDGVWETDTMSGINWSQVPVTIVEMGYMSNPEEDALMATEAYQNQLVQGIADGVDAYFGGN